MKTETLSILADHKKLGSVDYSNDKLSFRYEQSWLMSDDAYPLSVSMPLSESEHPHEVIEAYLWGLLPDNNETLARYGNQFQVSSRNVFRLLQHMGADCPGIIQIIKVENEPLLLDKEHTLSSYDDQVEWLTANGLAELIQSIKEDNGLQRMDASQGQFSLAGAQPKTALYRCPNTARWGVPKSSGIVPTTHILKPALGEYAGMAENEHFCLKLAGALGLKTASSEVIQCGDIPVIVVERYDRLLLKDRFTRIHQEDFCQARAILPQLKYESDGGPSVQDLAETIWEVSGSAHNDICTLADALILNYLIFGTDAHAKNYSLLYTGSEIKLAPLYDIVSALPYPKKINPYKARMAMKIGSNYKFQKVELRHWEACAKQLKLKPAYLLGRLETISVEIKHKAKSVAGELRDGGLDHPVIQLLSERIGERSEETLTKYFSK